MGKVGDRYRAIPRPIWRMIVVKFFVSMLNGAFLLIFNLFLRKLGFDDPTIGNFGSMLYLGILVVGLPCGLFLRGRRLKPVFMAGAILIPLFAIAMLLSLRLEAPHWFSKLLLLAWSGSFVLIDSFILPFIVRTVPKSSESEAIALNFSMFPLGSIGASLLIFLVNGQDGLLLGDLWLPTDEFLALMIIAALNLPLALIVMRLKEDAPEDLEKVTLRRFVSSAQHFEWRRIWEAVFPTTIIAVGAGLTIPFINLFFEAVFHLETDSWGLVGLGMAVIIFIAANLVPRIRRAFGYRIAITLSQSLSVLMLILMALTQLFADVPGMVYFAIAFFVLRTPLMNMARPMTSELVMNYVGPGNRDFTSALTASIWSGAWFLSALIFQWMRDAQIPYYQIFLLTALFYIFGVIKYYKLIQKFEKS